MPKSAIGKCVWTPFYMVTFKVGLVKCLVSIRSECVAEHGRNELTFDMAVQIQS
jgi:hypothetical protein